MNRGRLLIRSTFFTKLFKVQGGCLTSPILSRVLQVCDTHTHLQPNPESNMMQAYVCYDKDNDVFNFSFHLIDTKKNLNRQFNFTRRTTETISVFLDRIKANIIKIMNKKNNRKKKQSNVCKDIDIVKLLKGQLEVENDETCESFLQDPEEHHFIILGQTYSVKLNLPTVSHIVLPMSIMVGFPTYPFKFISVYTDKKLSKFYWLRNNIVDELNSWKEVGEGYMYTPTVSDIGYKLRLVCMPSNSSMKYGKIFEVISKSVVEAGPGPCPFEIRHEFTKDKLSGKSFRVLTYNILADTYADSEYSKTMLFSYCPPYALDINYRKQLILREIIGFNSDIICLQEVDNRVYECDLLPCLSTLNYDGVFVKKGEMNEGLATFFNEDRFEKLAFVSTVMSKNIDLIEFDTVWSKITNENMKERFLGRNTTIQVTTLRSKENPREIFVVGNTHLYFQPTSDNIRLLQGYYAIVYIKEVIKMTKIQNPDCNVNVLFCGDFNSSPDCGIYQLYTENYVPESCKDWKSNDKEIVENISLTQDIRMSSACGTPEYTNYTVGFSSCLDYIFYDRDKFNVEQVIPLPSKEEVTLHKGLPSVVFPSDHISLCADLKLIDN